MSLVATRDDTSVLTAFIESLGIKDRLPADWPEQVHKAMADISDTQTEFATQFAQHVSDEQGLAATQKIECFLKRMYDVYRAARSAPVPLTDFFDVLPLEALEKDPRGTAKALATLKTTVEEKLRPICDICIALAETGLQTENDFQLASRILAAIDDITAHAAALINGSFKTAANPAALIPLLNDNTRVLTELYDTLPKTNVSRLVGQGLPETLRATAHMSVADFICHSTTNGKTRSWVKTLAAYFTTGTAITISCWIWTIYQTHVQFETLATNFQDNALKLATGQAFLGVGQYRSIDDVPTHARWGTGWNMIKEACLYDPLFGWKLKCTDYLEPQPPEFLKARSIFYATSAAYTGKFVRATIGYQGFAAVLIVGMSVVYVIRNYDNIFIATKKLRGSAATKLRALPAPRGAARGASPMRAIEAPPSRLMIEAPVFEIKREPKSAGASRGRTPPRSTRRTRPLITASQEED